MTAKITAELENQTKAGFDEIAKSTDEVAAKAKKAEDAFNELVDAEIAAAKSSQQNAGQVREQSQAMRDYYGVTKDAARANQEFRQSANQTGETLDKLKSAADGNVSSLIKLLGQFKSIAVPVGIAVVAWKAAEVVLANTGKSADGTTNNLTKLQEAFAKVGKAATATAEETGVLKSEWQGIDDLTDSMVAGLEKLTESFTGVSTSTTNASEKIAASQAKQKSGAEEINKVGIELHKEAEERAAAEHLASIGTQQQLGREKAALIEKLRQLQINGKVGTEEFTKELANLRAISRRQIELKEQIAADYKERETQYNAMIDARDQKEREARAAKTAKDAEALQREADAIQRQIDRVNEARQRAADKEWEIAEKAKQDAIRIEQEKQDALKQRLEGQGVTGAGILGSTDPRQVLKNLQAQRRDQARLQFAAENEDPGMGPGHARWRAGQQRAMAAAGAQAFRDFRTGQVNPAELAQAQGQAAQQQISAMQQSGQLSGQTVQAVRSLISVAQQNQAQTAELQAQVQQIQQQTNALNQGARNIRQRAQAGGRSP